MPFLPQNLETPSAPVIGKWLSQTDAGLSLVRVGHNACRAILGLHATGRLPQTAQRHAQLAALFGALMHAERTGRLCKEVVTIPLTTHALEEGDYANAVSKGLTTVFLGLDHYAWLRAINVLKGEPVPIILKALKVITLAWFIDLLREVAAFLKWNSTADQDSDTVRREKKDRLWNIARCGALVAQGVHLSQLLPHSDIVCGSLGMYTGLFAALSFYPKAKGA
mmetsp:Transcript_20899/g.44990  ORF Transcript_20899/g.44990 Transcript_20899/m.44990 type:complete len:223 (-) Transcript_20899:127-795(-)